MTREEELQQQGKPPPFDGVEACFGDVPDLDDDGRERRTGTLVTASAHIITAVIGSGVLSLAWAVAQLGWVVGSLVLAAFAAVTWFCSSLLADCYRFPDPVHGRRNHTYALAVKAYLGDSMHGLCRAAQYTNLVGACVGYTITTAISVGAITRSNCFHRHGHASSSSCVAGTTKPMLTFAGVQVVLSQLPNFHKIWWLSIVAAAMSFTYSSIGLGLSVAKVAADGVHGHHPRTSLTGTTVGVDVAAGEKVWRTFQSLGDIAFAYTYSNVLVEIQDTLRQSSTGRGGLPDECAVMKRASLIGVSTTTAFYMLCGMLGYAAFGNAAPGNFLTGFGFYEPFWLVDLGNACVALHLVGAYQVFCQPLFQAFEVWAAGRWPALTAAELAVGPKITVSPFRLVWRTAYVAAVTAVAMAFPFFNDFVGLIGAVSFWPLTIYFPIQMHMAQARTRRFSRAWTWMNVLCFACLAVALVAVAGTVQGLVTDVRAYKPFNKS